MLAWPPLPASVGTGPRESGWPPESQAPRVEVKVHLRGWAGRGQVSLRCPEHLKERRPFGWWLFGGG